MNVDAILFSQLLKKLKISNLNLKKIDLCIDSASDFHS